MSNKHKLRIIVSTFIVIIFAVAANMITAQSKVEKCNKQIKVEQETTSAKKDTNDNVKSKKKSKNKNKKTLLSDKVKRIRVVYIEDAMEAEQDEYLDYIAEVYKEKSLSSQEVGVALNGTVVKVLSMDEEWAKIKSGSVEGYVESKYIVKGSKAQKVLLSSEHVLAKVKKDSINIKSQPNKKSADVGIAYKNTAYIVTEISENQRWIKIKHSDNTLGWISSSRIKLTIEKEKVYTSDEFDSMVEEEWKSSYISYKLEAKDLPEDSKAEKLLKYASQFLGNRYVWGGTSLTNGADCSGFTQSVFRHFGYSLSRTAAEQAHNGRKVSNNKLRPGDLLFYHTDKRNKNRISHVAIYIGNGKIIHSANRKAGIVISGMGNPCAVRRILSDKDNKSEKKSAKKKSKSVRKKNKRQSNKTKNIPKETEMVAETETCKIEVTTATTEELAENETESETE